MPWNTLFPGKTSGYPRRQPGLIAERSSLKGPDALDRPWVLDEKEVSSFKELQPRPRDLFLHRFQQLDIPKYFYDGLLYFLEGIGIELKQRAFN